MGGCFGGLLAGLLGCLSCLSRFFFFFVGVWVPTRPQVETKETTQSEEVGFKATMNKTQH